MFRFLYELEVIRNLGLRVLMKFLFNFLFMIKLDFYFDSRRLLYVRFGMVNWKVVGIFEL